MRRILCLLSSPFKYVLELWLLFLNLAIVLSVQNVKIKKLILIKYQTYGSSNDSSNTRKLNRLCCELKIKQTKTQ